MNYLLVKLAFDSPVHFGGSDNALSLTAAEDHVRADTLFSALCHTALQLRGIECLNQLCSWVKEGSLLLSDTMPWRDQELFLPKPYVRADKQKEIPAKERKAMKKLAWLPVSDFAAFFDSVKGGETYKPADTEPFGLRSEVTKAAVPDGEDAEPYQVGLYSFREGCGLYFIAGTETEEQKDLVICLTRSLGLSGIGGKISSGYGRFHIEGEAETLTEDSYTAKGSLCRALNKKVAERFILLTSALPKDEELAEASDEACFQLIRRSGFVSSSTYSYNPLKKKTQYFFTAGSVVKKPFDGDLYSVGGSKGSHPVYRYGKPLFLGVDL